MEAALIATKVYTSAGTFSKPTYQEQQMIAFVNSGQFLDNTQGRLLMKGMHPPKGCMIICCGDR